MLLYKLDGFFEKIWQIYTIAIQKYIWYDKCVLNKCTFGGYMKITRESDYAIRIIL